MGQFVSATRSGSCNDDLINFLINGDYIITENVEKALRCVDRGFYFSNDEKRHVYRDVAHQSDQIHLSAPGVYATALEYLGLQSGHKFLNIGSGIGYLNTVAGLLLGLTGVNHGIEINEILIDRAYQKMEEFKLHAAAIDHFNFCEPVFIHGNACDLLPNGYYDRVYCGAGVPSQESEFMKSLIKIGGILVMPLDGCLLKITRKTVHSWSTEELLEVIFTELVIPEKCVVNTVMFPTVEPLSLQELCKLNIRTVLRENIEREFPNLLIRTHCKLNTNNTNSTIKRNELISEFARLQYGVNEGRLIDLSHIVDSFVSVSDMIENNSVSGTSETSDINNSGSEDSNDGDIDEDDEDFYSEFVREIEAQAGIQSAHVLQNRCVSTNVDESTKRKSQESSTEDSEQNTALATMKNTKRMKIELSSQNSENNPSISSQTSENRPSVSSQASENKPSISSQTSENRPSTSSQSSTDSSWTTISTDLLTNNPLFKAISMFSSNSEDDDVSDSDSDSDSDDEKIALLKMDNPFLSDDSNCGGRSSTEMNEKEMACHHSANKEIMSYQFITDSKKNELSKLLKVKIDSLPIPNPLKVYLNYNRID